MPMTRASIKRSLITQCIIFLLLSLSAMISFSMVTQWIRDAAQSEFSQSTVTPTIPSEKLSALDTFFFFTPQTAYKIGFSMGSSGRHLYLTYFTALDTIYPLLYTLFIRSCLLLQKKPAWVVMLITSFDYMENAGIYWILRDFPASFNQKVAFWTGVANAAKWCFTVSILSSVVWDFGMFLMGKPTVPEAPKSPKKKKEA